MLRKPSEVNSKTIPTASEHRPGPARISILRARAADSLSALRLVLAAAWIVMFSAGDAHGAVLGSIAVTAAASDFLDGRLARRLGSASAGGQWFDGVADVVFVLAALSCESWVGAIPVYIPALIAASFAQYVLDSLMLPERSAGPRKSRLGHWGGILNYALVITLAFEPPPALPGRLIQALAPALGIFYLAAMGERAIGYRRRALSPDEP